MRYLTGTPHSPTYPVTQLMIPDLHLPQNTQEQMENLAKELLGTYDPWLMGIVPRTALAVLWLATHRQDVEPMVAQGQYYSLLQSNSSTSPVLQSTTPVILRTTKDYSITTKY